MNESESMMAIQKTTAAPMTVSVEGFTFVADSATDEPRVLDVEIGARVGLCRARDVRATIKKAIAEGFLKEPDDYRCMLQVGAENTNDSEFRGRGPLIRQGRPTDAEYWLTESGALKVITRLNTPAAQAIVGDMIRVYRHAWHQMRHSGRADTRSLEAVGAWLALQAEASRHNDIRRVGDLPPLVAEVRERCAAAADVQSVRLGQRVSPRKIAGTIRAYFRVSSHLDVRLSAVAELRRLLDALLLGTMLVKVKMSPAIDVRQIPLFG